MPSSKNAIAVSAVPEAKGPMILTYIQLTCPPDLKMAGLKAIMKLSGYPLRGLLWRLTVTEGHLGVSIVIQKSTTFHLLCGPSQTSLSGIYA